MVDVSIPIDMTLRREERRRSRREILVDKVNPMMVIVPSPFDGGSAAHPELSSGRDPMNIP